MDELGDKGNTSSQSNPAKSENTLRTPADTERHSSRIAELQPSESANQSANKKRTTTGMLGISLKKGNPDAKPVFTKSATMKPSMRPQDRESDFDRLDSQNSRILAPVKEPAKRLLASRNREEIRNSREKHNLNMHREQRGMISDSTLSIQEKKPALSSTLPAINLVQKSGARKAVSGLQSLQAQTKSNILGPGNPNLESKKPAQTIATSLSRTVGADEHKAKKGRLMRAIEKAGYPEPRKVNPLLAEPPKEKKKKSEAGSTVPGQIDEAMDERSDSESTDDKTKASKPKAVAKAKFIQNAASFEDWKRKNGMSSDQKVADG